MAGGLLELVDANGVCQIYPRGWSKTCYQECSC